jgi:hypothetical protein
MKRFVIGLLVLCAALPTMPASAESRRVAAGRTSFFAETPPLPISTLTGEWSGERKRKRVDIRGLHAAGDYTRFVARWTTPWSLPRNFPHVQGEASFKIVDGFGGTFDMGALVRHQVRGRSWSRWEGSPDEIDFEQGPSFFGASFAEGLIMSRRRSVRFDVKFVGRMEDIGGVDGFIDLMLRDPT